MEADCHLYREARRQVMSIQSGLQLGPRKLAQPVNRKADSCFTHPILKPRPYPSLYTKPITHNLGPFLTLLALNDLT